MYKILTCDCKIKELEAASVQICYRSMTFDYLYRQDHQIVVTSCSSYALNFVGFA